MVMFLSVVVVTAIGTSALGGPSEVFKRALDGDRLNFFKYNKHLHYVQIRTFNILPPSQYEPINVPKTHFLGRSNRRIFLLDIIQFG